MALARNAIGDVFVGTQGGGVFRSTDNAETWTGINNGLTDTNVQALAINSARVTSLGEHGVLEFFGRLITETLGPR